MRDPEVLPADVGVLARPPRTGGATFIGDDAQLRVPASVTDLESFCEWVETDDVPEKGNIWWLRGEVWADMSKEQLFTHVDLKGAIFAVLYFLVKQNRLGRIFTDGARLTNPTADLSGKPDAMFLSEETLDSDRALLMEGAEAGYVEVVGIPDMVLEVVSTSSVKKDLVVLLDDYWLAGIAEYWVVDARGDQLRFDIFRRGPKGYRRTPKKHGWMKSVVFGKSFRLSVATDKAGRPDFTLEVR